MKLFLIFGWSLLALGLGGPSYSWGAILIDNAPPDHLNSAISDVATPQYEASPFAFSGATTLDGINFWGIYTAGGPTSSFTISFFSDAGGKPGSIIVGGVIGLTGTLTGGTTLGQPEYIFQLVFSPVPFAAGNYWVSVFDGTPTDHWAWITHSQTGTHDFSQSSSSTGPWTTGSATLAFQITGVPEPTALIPIGLFLGLLGLARTRPRSGPLAISVL